MKANVKKQVSIITTYCQYCLTYHLNQLNNFINLHTWIQAQSFQTHTKT